MSSAHEILLNPDTMTADFFDARALTMDSPQKDWFLAWGATLRNDYLAATVRALHTTTVEDYQEAYKSVPDAKPELCDKWIRSLQSLQSLLDCTFPRASSKKPGKGSGKFMAPLWTAPGTPHTTIGEVLVRTNQLRTYQLSPEVTRNVTRMDCDPNDDKEHLSDSMTRKLATRVSYPACTSAQPLLPS